MLLTQKAKIDISIIWLDFKFQIVEIYFKNHKSVREVRAVIAR